MAIYSTTAAALRLFRWNKNSMKGWPIAAWFDTCRTRWSRTCWPLIQRRRGSSSSSHRRMQMERRPWRLVRRRNFSMSLMCRSRSTAEDFHRGGRAARQIIIPMSATRLRPLDSQPPMERYIGPPLIRKVSRLHCSSAEGMPYRSTTNRTGCTARFPATECLSWKGRSLRTWKVER